MPDITTAHDLDFVKYLDESDIRRRVEELGKQLARKYSEKNPVFLGVLNGAFVFTADLIRACPIDCEVSFVKLSSYKGMQSSGVLATLIGLEVEVKNRHVVIVEDIVDSGYTLHSFIPALERLNPASIDLVTFLLKPDALEYELNIEHIGFEIPNKFVIGYGLDYDGLGRNLPALYQLK
ncbi:MAG: hypoxanthine phosphoribosyltransferase [Saprospiraceae bacterium]|nr:hypoxanthine phosphoribosyltransferase [Saprospiraceae bacterium]